MSDSKNRTHRTGTPQRALDAAMGEAGFDPVRRALWLDALDRQLRAALPPQLADHCRLANLVKERLVFLVDTPVWRAKLRLATPELLLAARSLGLEATEVTVKIQIAPPRPPEPAQQRTAKLSATSREALQAALDSLQEAGDRLVKAEDRPPRHGRRRT